MEEILLHTKIGVRSPIKKHFLITSYKHSKEVSINGPVLVPPNPLTSALVFNVATVTASKKALRPPTKVTKSRGNRLKEPKLTIVKKLTVNYGTDTLPTSFFRLLVPMVVSDITKSATNKIGINTTI